MKTGGETRNEEHEDIKTADAVPSPTETQQDQAKPPPEEPTEPDNESMTSVDENVPDVDTPSEQHLNC